MSIIVSIIIPAYNADRFIAATLDCVLAQTFTAFEIIVINDGSTDQTAAIVAQYAERDPRIQLINQANQGISTTRQRGVAAAQGEYFAFLDADDQWRPHYLAAHLQHFAQRPQLGISFGRVAFMKLNGELTGAVSSARLTAIEPSHLYYENLLTTTSNAIVRRQVFEQIGGFDVELCGTEDQEFFLRTRCHGWEVVGLDQILVQYRITAGGLSSRLDQLEADWMRFSQKVRAYAPELVQQHEARARASFLRYIARRSLRVSRHPTLGIKLMHQALRSDWRLILQEPRRTILTLIAVYCKPLLLPFTTTPGGA
jgi:glycosyltransferase involved in cell wall biosynthesis